MRRAPVLLLTSALYLGCSSDEKAASSSSGSEGSTTNTTSAATGSTAATGTEGTDGASSTTATVTNISSAAEGATTVSGTSGSMTTGATSGAAGGTSSGGAGGSASTDSTAGGTGGGGSGELGFFVSSDTSVTGNLGGLAGADARCQALAEAVGAGARTWRAYLSAESDSESGNMPVNARDRIGQGPWLNSAGVVLANDPDELHALSGDPELFLDENGARINGQWEGSPTPNEHDILTGSDADGNLMTGMTCEDWTSESNGLTAQVGHSDGLGPSQNSDPPYNSWNSAHENGGCNDTAPRGGAGRIYCFAAD